MMRQYNAKNERIKYRYFEKLREANSKSKANVRAARNALYKYDQYFGFEDLETFDKDKAIAFKKFLLSTPSKKTGGTISESYVLHAVRYVAEFFKWLGSLPTYRSKVRIHEIDYFNLSNEDKAIALATAPRDYATVEQITGVIKNMSFNTDVEKRNRALICLLLLTGARISALITLKLKHLDLNSKSINQHPKDVKTKNRKRIKTYFFPVDAFVGDILHDYVQFLISKGFSKNDPIFPRNMPAEPPISEIQLGKTHWKSTGPARGIVTDSFEKNGLPSYCPHSFRNSLTQLAYKHCKTPEEFKAWSANLGHKNVLTTYTSYGHIDESRQGSIIQSFSKPKTIKQFLSQTQIEQIASIISQKGVQ